MATVCDQCLLDTSCVWCVTMEGASLGVGLCSTKATGCGSLRNVGATCMCDLKEYADSCYLCQANQKCNWCQGSKISNCRRVSVVAVVFDNAFSSPNFDGFDLSCRRTRRRRSLLEQQPRLWNVDQAVVLSCNDVAGKNDSDCVDCRQRSVQDANTHRRRH